MASTTVRSSPLQIAARICFVLLILTLPWSIASMSIAALLCGLLTLLQWPRIPQLRDWGPVAVPALGWLVALLLSAVFALDRSASLLRLGKGLLPVLVPLAAFHTATRRDGERALTLLLLSSAASSLFGIFFFIERGATFVNRARGAVGHYMTFGGQLLLLVSLAIGIALVARRPHWRIGAWAAALAGLVALAGTFTRSAWLGLGAALLIMMAAVRPRRVPILIVGLGAIYLLAPGQYRARLHSAFEPRHPVNLERTVMWETGIQMFLDRPLTGMGLQDLKPAFARYRDPAEHRPAGHLHSVIIQIAASMGIAGLIAFAFLYGSLFRAAGAGLAPMLRNPDLAAGVRLGVVGALSGFLVAGLFEWNFGDEELLYLLYVMVGLAWSARRWEPADSGAPAA